MDFIVKSIGMFQKYIAFIKRSLYTHKHDIAQPYHKVIDLVIKLVSLGFAIVGLFYVIGAPSCYLSLLNGEQSPLCGYFTYATMVPPYSLHEPLIMKVLAAKWFVGIGYTLAGMFLSQVLIVRHLNETLPDQIYLRCFSDEDQKKKKLPMKEHTF